MTAPATAKPLYRQNAHLVRQRLQVLNSSGVWVAFSGVPATVSLALTPSGAPIIGPSAALWNDAGELVLTISSSVIDAALAAVADGAIVYQIVTAGNANDYRGVTPLRVTTPRYVG
jgi:hypothetical protein